MEIVQLFFYHISSHKKKMHNNRMDTSGTGEVQEEAEARNTEENIKENEDNVETLMSKLEEDQTEVKFQNHVEMIINDECIQVEDPEVEELQEVRCCDRCRNRVLCSEYIKTLFTG